MNEDTEPGGEPGLELLLREIGPRERPMHADSSTVYETVRDEWLTVLKQQRRTRLRITIAIAASLTLAVGALFVTLGPQSSPATIVGYIARVVGDGDLLTREAAPHRVLTGEPIKSGETLRTSARGRVALQLASDLELRVDENSQLQFAAPGRVSLARGTIYVDAANAGGRHALVVETPFGTVQHVGTRYEARLDEHSLHIRVRDGEVRLTRKSGAETAREGEQLDAYADTVNRAHAPLAGEEWQWIEQIAPAFDIENRSLGEFLTWIGHATGCEVTYDSEGTRHQATQLILHGSVSGLTPESALAAVLSTTRFVYSRHEDQIAISPRQQQISGATQSPRTEPRRANISDLPRATDR